MIELWKPVLGYEGFYEISNLGQIKSLVKKQKKIIKNCENGAGYFVVTLCRNGKRRMASIHRLVAEAFIPNPKNLPQINHKDGVKTNNLIENIEWCTAKENMNHAWDTGLNSVEKLGTTKKVAQIKNGKTIKVWESLSSASRELGIIRTSISNCCCHRSMSAGGFCWKFA